jgi:S1-C subfamily serine protease
MGRRIWNGKFIGVQHANEKGVYSIGLKNEFIKELANSSGIRIFINRRPVSSLSLNGSGDALDATANCQKKYIKASAGTDTHPRPRNKGGSTGTGFFVSSSGHVATNHHVVDGCTTIKVFPVDAPPTNAYIVARDRSNDLAILKTSHEPTVVPALRRQVRTGESISVFGFPLSGLLSTSGNFTTGIVTAQTGIADDTRFVQISAPVQPGNSGGPLIDKYGNVVGVIVSKLNALNVAAATKDIPQNVNFAIKSSIAINFMESNAVSPNAAAKSFELPPEAIADLAKLFTVQISCD